MNRLCFSRVLAWARVLVASIASALWLPIDVVDHSFGLESDVDADRRWRATSGAGRDGTEEGE